MSKETKVTKILPEHVGWEVGWGNAANLSWKKITAIGNEKFLAVELNESGCEYHYDRADQWIIRNPNEKECENCENIKPGKIIYTTDDIRFCRDCSKKIGGKKEKLPSERVSDALYRNGFARLLETSFVNDFTSTILLEIIRIMDESHVKRED